MLIEIGIPVFTKYSLVNHEEEVIKTITPRPGRIVIFDGRIPHNVLPMNGRSVPSYRFTVALKFELKNNEPQKTEKLTKSELNNIILM